MNRRFSSVCLAVVFILSNTANGKPPPSATSQPTTRPTAPPTAYAAQDANFCAGLKRIAAAAPEQFSGFDAGEVRIGGGTLLLPNTRRSSATLPGVSACRILTGKGVSHACYFPSTSAADVVNQARALARTVGQCLGAATPRESMDGEYLLLTFQSAGLDYVVKVRPNTTINPELNVRTTSRTNARVQTANPSQSGGSANVYLAEGDKYFDSKDYARAIEAYKKAISLEPSAAAAYNGLGLAYSALKQNANAVPMLQQAIRIQPGEPVFHTNLGSTYMEMEQYENAKVPLKEALRLKPDYADAINLLGVAYYRLKQYPEAAVQFQRAIRLTPENGVLHHNLGKTYFQMGRKEEAQQVYRKLLTLDKESAQKLYEVINGNSAPAPKAMTPQSGAANADTYKAKGDQYWEAKDYANAIAAYKKAIAINPSHIDAIYLLATAYIQTEQWQLSISTWKKYLSLTSNPDANSFILLGNAHSELKQHAEALKAYQSAINLKPKPALLTAAYYWTGRTYCDLEQFENALGPFQRAVRLDPDATNYFWLGFTHSKLKQFESAIHPLQEALRLKPDYASAANRLGYSYLMLGQYPKAAGAFNVAIHLGQNDAGTYYLMGLAYLGAEDKEHALQVYRKLLSIDAKQAQELLEDINKKK